MNKLLVFLLLPALSFAQVDSTDIIVKQMMEKQMKKWRALKYVQIYKYLFLFLVILLMIT